MPPFDIQVLVPFSTAWSPSMRALHCMAATSEPASGSLKCKGGDRFAAGNLASGSAASARRAGQADGAGAQGPAWQTQSRPGPSGGPASRGSGRWSECRCVALAPVGRATHGVFQPTGGAQLAHQGFAFGIHIVAVCLGRCVRVAQASSVRARSPCWGAKKGQSRYAVSLMSCLFLSCLGRPAFA